MPTENVIYSTLTADLSSVSTTITITTGEWALFQPWMIATIEQLNDKWKATAREVVLISWINWNILTLTRWYENCVMNDTASPKQLWNIPQDFTTWATISVYVSRALLNGVQQRLEYYNKPRNNQVVIWAQCIKTCMDNCYECWRALALRQVAKCNCSDSVWFWDWSDWNCVINGCVFLDSTRVYNFTNLTINSWGCLRFINSWVPRIYVSHCFINNWVIDLRWGCYVWTTTITDWKLWTIWNRWCQSEYNTMCYGCGWLWFVWTCWSKAWNWWNANVSWCSWAWRWGTKAPDSCTNATDWTNWWPWYWWGWWWGWGWYYNRDRPESGCSVCPSTNGRNASWYNWWDWGCPWNWVAWNRNLHRIWWWGWWGWGYWTWNGWNWQTAWSTWWTAWAWQGWNGWIWWKWWDSLWINCSYTDWSWRWWNGYIWWNWAGWTRSQCRSWRWWDWWFWVICGWNWGDTRYTAAWNWWKAITNVYWFILRAYSFQNNIICAKWWNGWNWGNSNWWGCGSGWQSWNWGCGWNWGCVAIWYSCLVWRWTIDVSKWLWGCKWVPNACWWTAWTDWANWLDWLLRFCKIF